MGVNAVLQWPIAGRRDDIAGKIKLYLWPRSDSADMRHLQVFWNELPKLYKVRGVDVGQYSSESVLHLNGGFHVNGSGSRARDRHEVQGKKDATVGSTVVLNPTVECLHGPLKGITQGN